MGWCHDSTLEIKSVLMTQRGSPGYTLEAVAGKRRWGAGRLFRVLLNGRNQACLECVVRTTKSSHKILGCPRIQEASSSGHAM